MRCTIDNFLEAMMFAIHRSVYRWIG